MNILTNIPGDIVFVPYHASIQKVYMYFHLYHVNTQDESMSYAKFDLYVITNLGVRYTLKNKLFFDKRYRTVYIENWGELNVYSSTWKDNIPVQTFTEIWIEPRMDVAAMSRGLYKIDDVLTDRWFPSYNGCFLRIGQENITSYFDKKEEFEGWPATPGYKFFTLHKVIDNNLDNHGGIQINQYLIDKLDTCILSRQRIGIVMPASTVPTTSSANNDGNVNYHYPTWMHQKYKSNYNSYSVPPYYIVNTTDVYTGNPIQISYLNWHNSTVRADFISCMEFLHDYLVSNPINANLQYEAYIDFVKMAFAGTWGEGLSLNMPDGMTYPTAQELIEVSNSVFAVCGDKPHVFPIGTTMNEEFPQAYRDNLFASESGFFFDGVCTVSRYYYLEGNKIGGTVGNPRLSACTDEFINNAYIRSKKYFTSLECAQYLSSDQKSNYADLETFACYWNPDVYCLNNIFNYDITKYSPSPSLLNSIKRLSRFVGTRPYILLNNIYFSGTPTSAILHVNANLGNYGTALIREYWRLRFYIKDSDNNAMHQSPYESGVDLTTVPKPFEAGVPNYYDTKHLDLSITLSSLTLVRGNNYQVIIALEDVDGIYSKNLLFCNTESSLPREYNADTGNFTGRFYLRQNLKFPTA